ncbi:hypothetical protein [Onishia niordana]|uniref:hypothetical protein n=1 Tax=Onishia niordana TaxID=2508711 RepID=UPI0010A0BCD7|nr:hypothetical protein [Halomonas niordiana]
MKNTIKSAVCTVPILFSSMALAQQHATAFTVEDAEAQVEAFGELSSCMPSEEDRKFHAVKIKENSSDDMDILGQRGEQFAVVWLTDMLCLGGSGTTGWELSVVEIGAAETPFVNYRIQSPGLIFQGIKRVAVSEFGRLVISGTTYDPREGSGKWDFVDKTMEYSIYDSEWDKGYGHIVLDGVKVNLN